MPPFTHLEFHRSGIGLVPDEAGQDDSAIYIADVPGSSKPLRSCTCAESRQRTCRHLLALSRALGEVNRAWDGKGWEEAFAASVWHRLARLLYEGNPQASSRVRVLRMGSTVRVTSPSGEELAEYLDGSEAQIRFLERTGKVSGNDERTEDMRRVQYFLFMQVIDVETSEIRFQAKSEITKAIK